MLALIRTITLCLMLAPPPVLAADTPTSTNAPDLADPRAKIAAKDWRGAITELTTIADRVTHADVYNLLGFAYRKSGDTRSAATWYGKALDFDPDHKSALEYQGEMFVETKQMDKARGNLARLERLCPTGCEELDDLRKAVTAAEAAAPKARR